MLWYHSRRRGIRSGSSGANDQPIAPAARSRHIVVERDGPRAQRGRGLRHDWGVRMSDEGQVLVKGEAPAEGTADEPQLLELEELHGLIADGHERGYVTYEGIASALEEYEVSKEQVADLYSYL